MTFSIVARDASSGHLGVASATHAFGVGIVANFSRAGVGAVATQSFVELTYGPRGLELMAMGIAPQEALAALLSADPDREIRQVAYVDGSGAIAHHTGSRCVPSCGSVVVDGAIAIGNMLENERVLPAMADAFTSADGELAARLLAALEAGQHAGGDVRGRMSASLQVVAAEPVCHPWEGVVHNLRVDVDADPLAALARSLRMSNAYRVFFESVFAPGLVTGAQPVTGERLDDALAGLEATQRTLGDDLEPSVWQGVLLLRAGETARGSRLIAQAIAARPQFAQFIDGLASIGTIPMSADQIRIEAEK
jgi:uncharacterized Ntn-hydrolase superfamily protein